MATSEELAELYSKYRKDTLLNPEFIIGIEKQYSIKLVDLCLKAASKLKADFDDAVFLKSFWWNYAPRPRGRKPREDSIPWGEVGEKVISHNLVMHLDDAFPEIEFVGLPFGGDVRFMTKDAIIHFDIKLTGPNDNPNEVVVSPYQVSGDGYIWNQTGYLNSKVSVKGPRRAMEFQPELPPIYIGKDGKIRYCLTFFLKVIYSVKSKGTQPLESMELVSVPNGLLMFDGPKYCNNPGLMTPGKDEKTFKHKRSRIKLVPLSKIDSWRCVKFSLSGKDWLQKERID